MGSLADYVENEILDHVFKNASWSQPGALYIGLSTADPGDDMAGLAEPSGNNYARVLINSWAAAVNGVTSNSAQSQFPQATGAWGNCTHFAIFDALSGGNAICHGALASPFNVVSGNAPTVEIGDIQVQHSAVTTKNYFSDYLIDEVLDHIFKVGAFTAPATNYIALSTADPTPDGSGLAEPGGGSYARVACTWGTAANGSILNGAQVQFPQATAGWGTLTWWAVLDASSGGNMLFRCPLTNPRGVVSGNAPLFEAGALQINLN